jgi:thioredoxin reductase
VILESSVIEIKRNEVLVAQNGRKLSVPNDFVFIFIGGILPTEFLQSIGISIEKKFGER